MKLKQRELMSRGANLVPKLLRAHRTNGDDCHRFFESFVLVSVGWCSLVIT